MLGSEYTQTYLAALLLAAHPDDEVVGAAGWAWQYPGRLAVAFLTSGVPRDPKCFAPGFHDPVAYAATRRAEAHAVWRRHPGNPSLHFGPCTDQGLYMELERAGNWLQSLMSAHRPALILAPAYEGGHPDHDAANLLAAVAAQTAGIPTVEYALYHLVGSAIVRQRFAGMSDRLLPSSLAAHKRIALAHYASQATVLADFSPAIESLRPLPGHDYSQPPANRPTVYESWGWAMTATEVCAALAAHARRHGLRCGF